MIRVNNNNKSTPHFGMALHMPSEERIAKNINKEIASFIYGKKNELENLAKDVDVFVHLADPDVIKYPGSYQQLHYKRLKIDVTLPEGTPKDMYYMTTPVYKYLGINYPPSYKFYWANYAKHLVENVKYLKTLFVKNPINEKTNMFEPINPSKMINPKNPLNNNLDKLLHYLAVHRTGKLKDISKNLNFDEATLVSYSRTFHRFIHNELIICDFLCKGKDVLEHTYTLTDRAVKMAVEHDIIKPKYQKQFIDESKAIYHRMLYSDGTAIEKEAAAKLEIKTKPKQVEKQVAAKPEIKPEPKPVEKQVAAKPEIKPESKPVEKQVAAKPEIKPETKQVEKQVATKPEIKPESKQVEKQVATKPEIKPETKQVEKPVESTQHTLEKFEDIPKLSFFDRLKMAFNILFKN